MEFKMTNVYKVAKHIDSRPLSTHYSIHTAKTAKREAGYEYNIYGLNSKTLKWEKM